MLSVNEQAFSRFSSSVLALVSLISMAELALAQQSLSPCQPPPSNEYLLLVLSQTQNNHQAIQQTLPQDIQATLCQYQDDTVTRLAGFKNVEDANAWASHINDNVGFSTFVVQPASVTSSSPSPSAANAPGYNPQPLGDGYAVLVDYFNKPDVAAQVQQLLDADVGLVSYGQRPYLLAIYTTSEAEANSALRKLSNSGFWCMVVDSRRVTLLSAVVMY